MSDEKTVLKLPEGDIKLGRTRIRLDDLPKTLPGPKPEPRLIASIRRFGVLVPIYVARRGEADWDLLDGRRRLAGARECYTGEHEIDAMVLDPDFDTPDMRRVLTTLLNAQRSENPVTTMLAIEALVKKGANPKEIYEATGLRPQEVKKVSSLWNLIPELQRAARSGYMGSTIAYKVAKLPTALQQKLADETTGRITAKDVHEVMLARTNAAMASLPFGIDDAKQEPFDWRSAVIDGLQNLAKLIPAEWHDLAIQIGHLAGDIDDSRKESREPLANPLLQEASK